MTIKPIKTERDYQRTLKEIDKLWTPSRTQQRATDWMCWHTRQALRAKTLQD